MWRVLFVASTMLLSSATAMQCHVYADDHPLSDAEIRLIAEGTTIRRTKAEVDIEFQPNTDLSFLVDVQLKEVGSLRSIAAVQCTSARSLFRSAGVVSELVSLNLTLSDVSDLVKVAEFAPSLESLNVTGTSIDNFGFLSGWSSLRHFSARYTQFNDASVVFLRELPNLESLDLSNTEVTHNCLESISNIPSLNSLSIIGRIIDENNFAILKSLREDTEVILGDPDRFIDGVWGECGLPEKAISELRQAGLIVRGAPSAPREFTVVLETEPGSLQTYRLTWHQLIRVSDVEAASARWLNLSSASIDDSVLRKLHRFENITHLTLAGTRITDNLWARISQFAELQVLDVSDTRVSDAGIARATKEFKNLKRLVASDTRIVGTSITENRFPSIRCLKLTRFNPGWPNVKYFPACTTAGLRTILRHTRLSNIAVTWSSEIDPMAVKFMIQRAPTTLTIEFFRGGGGLGQLERLGTPVAGTFGPRFVFQGAGQE